MVPQIRGPQLTICFLVLILFLDPGVKRKWDGEKKSPAGLFVDGGQVGCDGHLPFYSMLGCRLTHFFLFGPFVLPFLYSNFFPTYNPPTKNGVHFEFDLETK